jgi:hypothetical protein
MNEAAAWREIHGETALLAEHCPTRQGRRYRSGPARPAGPTRGPARSHPRRARPAAARVALSPGNLRRHAPGIHCPRDGPSTAPHPGSRPGWAPGPQGQRWSAGTRRHRRRGTLAFDALFAAGASRETGPARVPSPCPPGECRTRTCTGASASDDVAVSFHEVTIPWGPERARGECSACGPCTRMFGCTYGAAPR